MSPLDRPARALALALLLTLMFEPPRAAAEGLTLAQAEQAAIDRDAQLREVRSRAAALRERAVASGALPDPQVRFGAVNVPTNSFSLDEDDMTMLEIGVSQAFKPGQSRSLARRQVEEQAAATEALASDRERVVRRDVRRLWTQLAYVRAARDMLDDQTSWIAQLRQSARARYASGQGQQLDVLRAGLDAAMLREQQLDLDRDEAMWRSQLSFWIGPDAAADATPSGLGPGVELPPLATLQTRLARHPSQVDFERRLDAAHTSVDLAKEQRRPSWMLDFGYGFRKSMPDGMQRPDMLSAMVTVDLPLFRGNRQDREVAAAHFEEQGLHDLHEEHRRDMTAMLDEAWNTVRRTLELERFYESDLLPLADQSVTAALLAWRSNRGMFEDVAAARRLALETRLKHLRLAADRALAQHDINYFAGDAE